MKIYTVVGIRNDDGLNIGNKSFVSKEAVTQCVEDCYAYDQTRPNFKRGDQGYMRDWELSHPIGIPRNYGYYVIEHELIGCDE